MEQGLIFAVDDDINCLEVYRMIASSELPGFSIETFNNPLELALRVSEGRTPVLVITDGKMSPIHGWELAVLLRRIGYHGSILLVSGESDIPMPSAFTNIVQKPFDLIDLVGVVLVLTSANHPVTH